METLVDVTTHNRGLDRGPAKRTDDEGPLHTHRADARQATAALGLSGTLRQLPPIELGELASQAALLKRVDRKYLISPALACELVRYLGECGGRALTIGGRSEFHYLSDYFDTPDFSLHRMAATKRRRRFKVRSRLYLDSGLHFAELKTRGGRGHNVKDRLRLEDVPLEICERLKEGLPIKSHREIIARAQVAEWVAARLTEREVVDTRRAGTRIVAGLRGALRSAYTRSTLLIPGECRVTIDQDLVLRAPDAAGLCVPGVVVETKSSGGSSDADRWLWRHEARPMRFSKYAVGVANANPQLPANRWHRTLNDLGEMK